jgi:hypothetical protein
VAHEDDKAKHKPGRREFVKKAAYVTPAILTLAVAPSYAKAGSRKGDPKPPKPPKAAKAAQRAAKRATGRRYAAASLTILRVS